jgi:hypothetical protein
MHKGPCQGDFLGIVIKSMAIDSPLVTVDSIGNPEYFKYPHVVRPPHAQGHRMRPFVPLLGEQ